jgi:hypothetical protein
MYYYSECGEQCFYAVLFIIYAVYAFTLQKIERNNTLLADDNSVRLDIMYGKPKQGDC